MLIDKDLRLSISGCFWLFYASKYNSKNLFLINMFHFCFFISFEIYLMFEVVSEGRYSLMRIIDNPFFAFVVYVISSVLLGCILHFIVKYIKNMCFNCS
ncbi:hypothetical protein DW056_19705 [Parabacteroides distasonis]|jgi:hypothetical protein|nr:hypothetical protein DW056_19705 [Parabacteroides distasonis]